MRLVQARLLTCNIDNSFPKNEKIVHCTNTSFLKGNLFSKILSLLFDKYVYNNCIEHCSRRQVHAKVFFLKLLTAVYGKMQKIAE